MEQCTNKIIIVLNSYRPYHRLLKALNIENFRHIHWCDISVAILSTLSTSLPLFVVVLGFWHLIENESDLKKFVVSLPILISLVQMEVAIIAMIANNRTTSQTIEQVQKVTNQRRFYTFTNCLRAVIKFVLLKIIILLGCLVSEQSYQIYINVEASHSLFTSYLVKCLLSITSLVFVSTAMLPVSYAIFGFPPPQLWALPFEAQ